MSRRKWLNMFAGLALILVVLGALSCASAPEPTATAVPETALPEEAAVSATAAIEKRKFTAVLFPYIPDSGEDDFASLKSALKTRFEAANPEINLEITMDQDQDLYDFATLATLLGTGKGSADMVELDTLVLGELVSRKLLKPLPFSINNLGLLPAALAAANVNSTFYAVPTYVCGNYIYSWNKNIRLVKTGQGLIDFLTQDPSSPAQALVGNFKGSWTLSSLYVDAWADTHTNDPDNVKESYGADIPDNEIWEHPLDEETMNVFAQMGGLCGDSGGPCLDGDYRGNNLAETLFAQHQANGFLGYSERLFFILKARGGDSTLPYVISAPLGKNSNPVMFVDALVPNPSCTGQCAMDAESFSRFMSSLEVRNLIAFSEDVSSNRNPRYLLQALASFYTSAPGNQNPIYRQLAPFVMESQAMPNQRFAQGRMRLWPNLVIRLGGQPGIRRFTAESPVGQMVGGVEIREALTRFPFPVNR